ncbi:MAG: phospholipid carrier-dependent glycosyltransferase [Methylacidiphilales bacterium]|nr:phospholipid carrier-dependent glycosyltransferase [Candidatus Methylacidiphilales bacterium]
MAFLFSTRINRLAYLGRHILSLLVLGLGTLAFIRSYTDSSANLHLGIGFGALFIILGLGYYVRFAVLARMESIGMSAWNAFCLMFFTAALLFGLTLIYKWVSQGGISPLLGLYITLVLTALIFDLVLLILSENYCRQANLVQVILYDIEVGSGRVLIRLIPLLVGFGFLLVFYDFSFYRGLNDAQSMDNAQVARQIVRGEGFTTEFLRPYALAQMHAYAIMRGSLSGGSGDLFPLDRFPAGTPRILPDTYNAPGYPYLLAAWFKVFQPQFAQTIEDILKKHQYAGDRWIPEFNQLFIFLTLLLVFMLGRRLFDERVAWISVVAFMLSDTVWRYSTTALSTPLLMFLVTALLVCALEIFTVSEKAFEKMSEGEEGSMTSAWPWSLLLGLLLAVACLTRLHLLILLVPLLLFFIVMPRTHPPLFAFIAVLVIGPVALWLWHTYRVCGNPIGSNLPLLLFGGDEHYMGNEIYCTTAIPSYEQLFQDASKKEYTGFLWHFERGWSLLGPNPMVLLAIASFLHRFKRRQVRAFQWLVAGCIIGLIAVNNLGSDQPEAGGAWNVVILLLPALVVLGTSLFFVLLDRMDIQIPLLRTLIVISTLVLTALPMTNTLTTPGNYYNFPPYLPPVINGIARMAAPDEWVTTDMPWATAWYADRASLWLPDSITDFENFHDNVCPTGMLLLTPVSLDQSTTELRAGEFKDWYALYEQAIFNNSTPPQFPLSKFAIYPIRIGLGYDYMMWSDRQRWGAQK